MFLELLLYLTKLMLVMNEMSKRVTGSGGTNCLESLEFSCEVTFCANDAFIRDRGRYRDQYNGHSTQCYWYPRAVLSPSSNHTQAIFISLCQCERTIRKQESIPALNARGIPPAV